ncbi:MAG TPA: radical SAM protein [Verrucomicrobiae bacterium]|nr:radical SAM protein [Verrucomicrobiae bacterium]
MTSPTTITPRRLRILLVKPKASLRTVIALQRFQLLEPIELGYLAAAVGPEHEVRVLDLRFESSARRALEQTLIRFRPDVVGLTGYTHVAVVMKDLARLIRRTLPDTCLVIGGHHATVAPDDFDMPEIDMVVRGEGCGTFRAIVDALANHRPLPDLPGTRRPGPSFRQIDPESWPAFPGVEKMPVPRRDLWDHRRYYCVWTGEESRYSDPLFPPVSMVRSSFGCRMTCSFCIVPKLFGGRHYARDPEEVAREIANLATDHVYFCDDENFIDPEFADALADALERMGVKKHYFAWARTTTVNRHPELFRRWRALGLDVTFLGFEFATDDMLRRIRKGSTLAQNEQALEVLRGLNIAVHVAFMILPEWGVSDFEALRDYVARMPPAEFSFTVCTPSPGTADYDAMRSRIWVEQPSLVHDCMHPLLPTKLSLREFSRQYSLTVAAAARRNPMRVRAIPRRARDLLRVLYAEFFYVRSFRRLHKDFPPHLRHYTGRCLQRELGG